MSGLRQRRVRRFLLPDGPGADLAECAGDADGVEEILAGDQPVDQRGDRGAVAARRCLQGPVRGEPGHGGERGQVSGLRDPGAAVGQAGRRMPPEEFLRRVAAREGADADEAGLMDRVSEDVRAAFVTLAEAVSGKEWFDVTAELPAEYGSVIPPPPA